MRKRERVLVEDGTVAPDIAAGLFNGLYGRGEKVIAGRLYLTPSRDGATTFHVHDRRSEEVVETVNLKAIHTSTVLVGLLREIEAELERDDE